MRRLILLLATCSAWGQAWYPAFHDGWMANLSVTNATIDATGEKFAMCGGVWTPTQGTKSIRKVGFVFGSSITKAGGSALTLSLQSVDTATGPPIQPDGTQDQTVAIANGSITASTFLLSGALSADRSVSYGEQVCAVIEFDGAGRLGSDSITIGAVPRNSANAVTYPNSVLYTASWATFARVPIIVFEFSDGSYGTLDGASVFSSYTAYAAYNSSSGTDEYALKFSPPVNGTITGVSLGVTVATGADFDVVLYNGTTSVASVSIDANTWDATASSLGYIPFPATSVSAGTTYYLALKPTTTNNVTVAFNTVASNSYLGALPQGTGWVRSSRADAGSWSDTTTIVPNIRFRFTPSAGGSSGGAYVVAQ